MVKRAFHVPIAGRISERRIRGVMALEDNGLLNTGISARRRSGGRTGR
jgi:hypothetical protein